MIPSTMAKALTTLALTALAAAAPAAKAANHECSNATLKGTYSDRDTGYIVGVGPFAGAHLYAFDGHGGMTVSGMVSINGSISSDGGTGTYTVNPDCTGTFTGGSTVHGYFVIDDGGNELQTVITDPGTVINCVARKQFPKEQD